MLRRHPILAGFTALYCAGFLAWAISNGNREFVFYFMVMLAIIGLVMWANIRARFSPLCLWLLSLWGLCHMAGGNIPVPAEGIGFGTTALPGEATTVLYNLWLLPGKAIKYDQITHSFGFFAATLACWQSLRGTLASNRRTSLAVIVLTACAGMGLGAVNEIVEYIATLRGPTNVGGYDNNAQDLIFNAIGALGAAAAVAFSGRHHESRRESAAPVLIGLFAMLILAVAIGGVLARITRTE